MADHEQDSLFAAPDEDVPLAERLRPGSLADYVGQGDLVGEGTPLRRAIEQDRLHSMILWGPPGSGKTTLARIVAGATAATFVQLSAVLSGVRDAREVMESAAARKSRLGERTVLFVDEIHRFNKAQQDAFLPHVERGDIVLVGATTENPSFGVISPLLSRCRTYTLKPLADEAIRQLLEQALSDDRVLAPRGLAVDDDAAELILTHASGDARRALNLLEVVADSLPEGDRRITLPAVEASARSRTLHHDKSGEEHYNVVSAFIKSMRDSDPDAALYWMARMLLAGEDPLFICRRMVILAAEDVGLADPNALQVAVAARQAFEQLGLPEGEIPLAEACVYLATAPKSNASYAALKAVKRDVEATRAEPVPLHLRNAATGLMKRDGYGEGYEYAHDADAAVTGMSCLPDSLAGRRWYHPTERGHEQCIAERLEQWRSAKDQRRRSMEPGDER